MLMCLMLAAALLPYISVITSTSAPISRPTPAATETPAFVIKKGRRVDPNTRQLLASQGECLDTSVSPATAALLFGVASAVAFVGFDTETNRADGSGRRKAVTWLALQAVAVFGLRPQLSDPCSEVNGRYR